MSQATAAHAAGSGDAAEMRRIAGQMEEDNPDWIVLYGVFTREFVAFPRFDAPRGTVLSALYPAALPPRMRSVEATARPAPGGRAPGDPEHLPAPPRGQGSPPPAYIYGGIAIKP